MLLRATLSTLVGVLWVSVVFFGITKATDPARDVFPRTMGVFAGVSWLAGVALVLRSWSDLRRFEHAAANARAGRRTAVEVLGPLAGGVSQLPLRTGILVLSVMFAMAVGEAATGVVTDLPFVSRGVILLLFFGGHQGALLLFLGAWRTALRGEMEAFRPSEVAAALGERLAPRFALRLGSAALFAASAEMAVLVAHLGESEQAQTIVQVAFAAAVLMVTIVLLSALWLGRQVSEDVEALASAVRDFADAGGWKGGVDLRPLRGQMRLQDTEAIAEEIVALGGTYAELAGTEANARKAAERTRRLKTHLMAFMGHDLRSPLNSIGGFAEILMQEIDGPINAEQRASLQAIRDSGDDLLRLITDMVDSARFEAGKLSLHRDNADLRAVVEGALSSAREFARGKDIRFELSAGHSMEQVWIDGTRLHQALTGVLFHVVRMVVDGVIELRVSQDEHTSEVEVFAATLPPEDTRRIFLAFREIRRPSGGRVGGLGLGLFLARSLAVAHGGELLYDKREEAGARFVFRLPRRGPWSPGFG